MDQQYTFHFLDKAIFSTLENRESAEYLRKWGFLPHMRLFKFRFDIPFNEFNPEGFLLDLINSPEVQAYSDPIRNARTAEKVSEVSYKELKCTQTSLDYFNILKEVELVASNGYIKKIIPEYFEDIEICDKIREALLIEECENFNIFDESYRNEFLFRIFQHIAIGGGMCQYEDEIEQYLEVVKGLYKDLISVTKDNESNELRVLSKAYQLLPSSNFVLFVNQHVQDFCYVIIDPSYRHVNIWYHKWTNMW